MAEQRFQLTPVQWNSLASIEMRLTELNAEVERQTEVRNLSLQLILDAHGIVVGPTKALKGIDAQTKELVIETNTSEIQATAIPSE